MVGKNLWNGDAPERIFRLFVKIALERKFRVENGGLKNGTYPKCTYMYMEVPPPPGGFTNKILLTDWEESHVSDA